MFLTCNTVVQNIFGWTVSKGYATIPVFQRWRFIISGITSVAIMLLLFFLTNLGLNVKRSFSNSSATPKRTSILGVTQNEDL